ncbi:hypothetical protein B0H63DRAFT_540128 [Podospora didyma]|uniref:G-protein coupled receptors family 1 profile domain-containing protein n=1 Tax=Podospora didyma TaxID=330526 RepID=A0AAE0JX97_9PEZI|nr:hypothetical protein B0H63DRAFT_540128 [Podospora didyma]
MNLPPITTHRSRQQLSQTNFSSEYTTFFSPTYIKQQPSCSTGSGLPRYNGIDVHTRTCVAQGWLVSTGNLASSCFITAIAVNTYLAVVRNYTPPQWALHFTVVGLWVFDYLLAILGPLMTSNGREAGGFYVRAHA